MRFGLIALPGESQPRCRGILHIPRYLGRFSGSDSFYIFEMPSRVKVLAFMLLLARICPASSCEQSQKAEYLDYIRRAAERGERARAEWAARLLSEFGDLRDAYPADFVTARVEYENGLPALANFFFLPPYTRA